MLETNFSKSMDYCDLMKLTVLFFNCLMFKSILHSDFNHLFLL